MAEAKLVAKVETQGVKKSTDELKKFSQSADDSEKSVNKFGARLKSVGGTISSGVKTLSALGASIAAVTGSVTALAVRTAESEREIAGLAQVARTSTEEFKALTFAANQYNISGEKLSDISKDVNEKLGEFIATGGGGFKDFFEEVAPQIDLTAQELQNLSGPQVLQEVVKALEAANVPLEQQSFFLESIASDTTLLIPLLQNESAELNRLTSEYDALNSQLALTASEQGGLRQVSESFNLLGETASNALSFIVSKFAPEINAALESASSAISGYAEAIGFLIESFQEGSEAALQSQLLENLDKIAEEENAGIQRSSGLEAARQRRIKWLEEENQEILNQINALRKLEEQEKKAAEASQFSPTSTGGFQSTTRQQEQDSADQENLDRQQELLQRRFDLANEFRDKEFDAELEHVERMIALQEKQEAELMQSQMMILNSSASLFDSLAGLAKTYEGEQSSTYKALFAVSKAFAIANSLVNLSSAISQAAADPTALTPAQKFANIAAVAGALGSVVSSIQSAQFNPSARQQGGMFNANQPYLVGEKGPELVQFGSGGRIASNQQTRELMGGSTNVTIINQTTGRIDETQTTQQDDGDLIITIRETINSEVLNPNSQFNKNMSKTRKEQRQF